MSACVQSREGSCFYCASSVLLATCPTLTLGLRSLNDYVTAGRPCGCGTELKAVLNDWLGIEASPTCSCSSMARRMDSLGPDWCEGEGMASILDVMRAEHGKRWQDGRTILPWTDAGARQLVLLACRRSRAKAAG